MPSRAARSTRSRRGGARPPEPQAVPVTKAIYIYPGLLRLARQKAINLDSQCPATIYKCAQCREGSAPGDADTQACSHSNGCSICLEDFHARDLVRKMPCSSRHVYHTNCILTWFASSKRCPLCQEPINDSRKSSSKGASVTEGRSLPAPAGQRSRERERGHEGPEHPADLRGRGQGRVAELVGPQSSTEPQRETEPPRPSTAPRLRSLADEQIHRDAQGHERRPSPPTGAKRKRPGGGRSYSYIDYDSCRFSSAGHIGTLR
jgi:hypothetical protein